MLIIAIPKSASTALVSTLSARHALPVVSAELRLRLVARCPVAEGYVQLARLHRREVVEIDAEVAREVAAPGLLAKFHFPPTPNNQSRLASTPKVVLLRDPREIVSAYKRGDETGAFRLKSYEFCYCLTEQGWQARAEKTGLLAQLRAFADGWRAHPGDKLVLEAEELIGDPAGALARVERYFGLPPSGVVALRQEKFTRDRAAAPPRGPLRVMLGRHRLVVRRLLADACRSIAIDPGFLDHYGPRAVTESEE